MSDSWSNTVLVPAPLNATGLPAISPVQQHKRTFIEKSHDCKNQVENSNTHIELFVDLLMILRQTEIDY